MTKQNIQKKRKFFKSRGTAQALCLRADAEV